MLELRPLKYIHSAPSMTFKVYSDPSRMVYSDPVFCTRKDHYKPFQKDHYKPRTSLTEQAVCIE